MSPYLFDVKVTIPANPVTYAWYGAQFLAEQNREALNKLAISKKEYEEKGLGYVVDKFDVWYVLHATSGMFKYDYEVIVYIHFFRFLVPFLH